jgi:hypothetical protein
MFDAALPVGLGLVLDDPALDRPIAVWSQMPPSLLKQLVPRLQQIGQAELAAALLLPLAFPDLLRNKFVIHFIDNQSAVAGILKGYSRACDSAVLAALYNGLMASAAAAVWVEYVESSANLADGPSRRGCSDDTHSLIDADLQYFAFPDIPGLLSTPTLALLLSLVASLAIKPDVSHHDAYSATS